MTAERSDEAAAGLASLRRELGLRCDRDGRIVWADEPARRLVGVEIGAPLLRYAVPGTEAKLAGLLERLREGPVAAWEGCLVVGGTAATLDFRGRPCDGDGEIALVADLVPEATNALIGQVQAALAELASLHRETERQQRELVRRNQELVRLNHELDDSSRGLVALHAEVDEKNDSLRRLAEVRARMVSNVSHEFRTPLNSIIGLANMLKSRLDGDLTDEQEKQVDFIVNAAESLSALVNDVLDLSKMEAGKVGLSALRFSVETMFAALRGMMRPLLTSDAVELRFVVEPGLPELETDEGKISQILKNLIGNAIKFTPRGSITVAARAGRTREGAPAEIVFSVTDTGPGIASADHERVFEEFTQLPNAQQVALKGTGLGLSISRRLATILGGRLSVESRPGEGAAFVLEVPAVHAEVSELDALVARSRAADPSRAPVLVVEDDRQTLFLYEKYLRGSGFQVVPARSIEDARETLKRVRPAAIVLDIMLEGETSWSFLSWLKSNPETSEIPILVVTVTNRNERARALGADEFMVKPVNRDWLLGKLTTLSRRAGPINTVLVIDDDDVWRYLVRKMLQGTPYKVLDAADGAEGLALAREVLPEVIFLDFVLPGMTAFDVIDDLKCDPRTRHIPIVVHTSKTLDASERQRLESEAASLLPKQSLNREAALARIREALHKAGVDATAPKSAPHPDLRR